MRAMGAARDIGAEPARGASLPGPVPSVPRGSDRRAEPRPDTVDWRVNPRSYSFLGAPFDPLTPAQTLQRVKWMSAAHAFRYLVTPNVDHIVRLWREPEVFVPLYKGSWLSVCDSRILEVMAQVSGVPLSAVPGSTLTQQIFDNLIAADEPVNVIGGDAELISELRALYGLKRINHHVPPMGLRENARAVAECARFVARHPTRYTFICVGSPQQEMVARACADRGDCVGLGLCVGASLEFLAGRIRRAPAWMQRARLEWLHRLASEPGRLWRRYLLDGPKIFLIWAKWGLGRRP